MLYNMKCNENSNSFLLKELYKNDDVYSLNCFSNNYI